jgi:hypothetical protein
MPAPTAAVELTLPDDAQLARGVELLSEATEVLTHLAWVVRRVGDADALDEFEPGDAIPPHRRHPGDEVPSLEAIGRLFSFAGTMHSYIEELSNAIEDVGGAEALWKLDSVRLQADFAAKRGDDA